MNLDSHHGSRVRLRRRLRAQARHVILEAAEEVFSERGLQQAGMESIAARAGVAVGTLYNHFDDREALVAALVQSRRQALLERVDRALAETEGAPFEVALEALLTALFGYWAEHAGLLSALLLADELGRPLASRLRGPRVADRLVRRVEAVLQRGLAEGRLRPEGAEEYPALLVGMARGLLVQGGFHAAPDRAAARVLDLFLRGAGT